MKPNLHNYPAPKWYAGLSRSLGSLSTIFLFCSLFFSTKTFSQKLILTKTDVTCHGGSDGSVTVDFDGVEPMSISINGGPFIKAGASPELYSNFTAGTYTFTLKDFNGETTKSITIKEPDALSLNLAHTNVSCSGCSDGSITATFSGGTSPYQIQIDGGGFTTEKSPKNFTGLSAGSHTVDLKDAHGCTTSKSETIGLESGLVFDLSETDVSCNGGSDGTISAAFSGNLGRVYGTLDNGGASFQSKSPAYWKGLSAGVHTVSLYDAGADKSTTKSITINQPAPLSLDLAKTDASCAGCSDGTITATFSGGTAPYQVSVDNGVFRATSSPDLITNIVAGSHTIELKDAHGCTTSKSITVDQPNTQLSLAKTDVGCNGTNSGTITATYSGTTGTVLIKIDGGDFSEAPSSPVVFPSLAAGLHTVVLKNGNSTVTKSITINEPAPLSLNLSATGLISCNGGNNGEIAATFGGGTAPYQIQIDGGGFTTETSPFTFKGLSAGSHTIDIKDANGCTTSGSITMDQPDPLILDLTKTDLTSCTEGSGGTITATFSGGSGYILVQIDGGGFEDADDSPFTFTGLSAGSHTVDILDDNDCTTSKSITINQPAAPRLDLFESVSISCNGGNNGEIAATFEGGTAPYQIQIDGGGFTTETSPFTFTGLSAGSHTVDLKDANGCTTSESVTMDQPDPLVLDLTKTDITSCSEGSGGTITATFSGGEGFYDIQIDGGGFEHADDPPVTFTGLSAGSHTVDIKDENDCTVSKSITINGSGGLTLDLGITHPIDCNGGFTTITATFSGGTAPYEVRIDGHNYLPEENSPTYFTGEFAGVHTIDLKDANGCTISKSITVDEPAALTLDLANTKILCYGLYSTVTATYSGGTAPYEIQVDNGVFEQVSDSVEVYEGMEGGSYTFYLKDANGCTISKSITINEPAPLSLDLTKTDVTSCNDNDGSVTATFSGGTAPYLTSLYADDAFEPETSPWVVHNLSAGSHTIYVQDANGCTISQSITVDAAKNCGPIIANIFPTQTTCSNFTADTAGTLSQICYTTTRGKVFNATPGVFFYYTEVVAPSANFCVTINQSRSCAPHLGNFLVQHDQVYIFDANCLKVALGTGNSNGQASVCITNATPGATYVISVKYDVKSITGTTSNGACMYTFNASINGSQVENSEATIVANPDCSVALIAPKTAAASLNQEISSELKVTAAPNPFTSQVNFHFVSPVTGKAILQLYDFLGRKLAVVYTGYVNAGAEISVQYNIPGTLRVPLIYKLDVGDRSTHGKLIPIR